MIFFLTLAMAGLPWPQFEYCGQAEYLNPKPSGLPFFDIIEDGDRLVLIGDLGTMLATCDFEEYTELERFTDQELRRHFRFRDRLYVITYQGGLFHAPGVDGPWTQIDLNETQPLNGAAVNSERAVIVGSGGAVYTSEDGLKWTKTTFESNRYLTEVIWAGGQFVIGGWNGELYTSPDGLTWTQQAFDNSDVHAFAWNGSLYVAVGYERIYTSKDAVTWTQRFELQSSTLYDVIWTGERFIALGVARGSMESMDGLTWTPLDTDNYYSLWHLGQYHDQYVSVGFSGMIMTSPDGKRWEHRTTTHWDGHCEFILDVGERILVSGMLDQIAYTENGETWQTVPVPISGVTGEMATDGKLIVMVGNPGKHMISWDGGLSWDINLTGFPLQVEFDIIWNGSVWLALSSRPTSLISTNGLDWEAVFIHEDLRSWDEIIWTGTEFVGANDKQVFTSPDGVAWERHETISSDYIEDLAFNGQRFVAVSSPAYIMYSDDARSWTQATVPTGVRGPINSVEWNGYFWLAANFFDHYLVSYDGIEWFAFPWLISSNVIELHWFNGYWMGAATNSTLIKLPCLSCLDQTEFQLTLPQWGQGFTVSDLIFDATRICR